MDIVYKKSGDKSAQEEYSKQKKDYYKSKLTAGSSKSVEDELESLLNLIDIIPQERIKILNDQLKKLGKVMLTNGLTIDPSELKQRRGSKKSNQQSHSLGK